MTPSRQNAQPVIADDKPPLDRWRFDAVIAGPAKLWGLPSIAQAAGVAENTVRRWARRGAPIHKVGGRWFTTRAALNAWLAG